MTVLTMFEYQYFGSAVLLFCTKLNCNKRQIWLLNFVQNAFLTKFAIQIAQLFEYNIFRAIKISKDIEKKLCICYYLCSDIVALCGHILKSLLGMSIRWQHWVYTRIKYFFIFQKEGKRQWTRLKDFVQSHSQLWWL